MYTVASKADTLGVVEFVLYREVSLTQGFWGGVSPAVQAKYGVEILGEYSVSIDSSDHKCAQRNSKNINYTARAVFSMRNYYSYLVTVDMQSSIALSMKEPTVGSVIVSRGVYVKCPL